MSSVTFVIFMDHDFIYTTSDLDLVRTVSIILDELVVNFLDG